MPMIGEFEKPIYVNFDENLCAHSETKLTAVRVASTSALLARLPALETQYPLIRQSVVAVGFAVRYVHLVLRKRSIHPLMRFWAMLTGSLTPI